MRRLLHLLHVPALATAARFRHTTYPHDQAHISLGSATPAHASFEVPCSGCLNLAQDSVVSFDFQAYTSADPCGANFTLNGAPLTRASGTVGGGVGNFKTVFGRSVDYVWTSSCLHRDTTAPLRSIPATSDTYAQVLTVQVLGVGGKRPTSPTGFTLSFKQHPEPKLLRLQLFPASPLPSQPAEDWREPPPALRIDSLLTSSPLTSTRSHKQASIDWAVGNLRRLERERQSLDLQIKAAEAHLNYTVRAAQEQLSFELQRCYSWSCGAKAIGTILNGAVHSLVLRLHPDHVRYNYKYFTTQAAGGFNKADMYEKQWTSSDIQKPAPAYISTYDSDGYQEITEPEYMHWHSNQNFRHRSRKNRFLIFLNFLAVVLGLAAIFYFVKRRFSSLRRRTERAADREQRSKQRSYSRAAKRAAFKRWCFSGWGRRKDAKRVVEYEEKRALVIQGESRLEAAMQDEIATLCREETMYTQVYDFQHAHGVIDELVRAEEGRASPLSGTSFTHHRGPGLASIAGLMMGRQYAPAHMISYPQPTHPGSSPIRIPPSTITGHSQAGSIAPPSYRTDPESDDDDHSVGLSELSDLPPSYRSGDDSSSDSDSEGGPVRVEIVVNGFVSYEPREYSGSSRSHSVDGESMFTPGSMSLESSPRQSGDMTRG